MQLNSEQQEAIDTILNSDERVICLLGKAGSGKSFTISHLAEKLKDRLSLTATTNKAKNLLEINTGFTAYTIHSFCGYSMIVNGIEKYLTHVRESEYNEYVVVDEVSMLTQGILNTLLATPTKKIILVGDLTQLPAIGLRVKLNSYKTIKLTKQMRQVDNQPLTDWLETLRDCVDKKRVFNIDEAPPKGITLYESHKEFCTAYLRCTNQKRILTYSNSVADSYNRNINNGVRFKVGDLIVLDTPIEKYRNGDIVTITALEEKGNHYDITIEGKCPIIVFKTKTYEEELKKNSTDYYKTVMEKLASPKLIYASTVHKAQGDSIDEVFIDITDIYAQLLRKPTRYNNYNKPISVDEYLRLLYVSISRMRFKAHLFVGDKRNYKTLRSKK